MCKYLQREEERGKYIKCGEVHNKKNNQVIAKVAQPNVEKVEEQQIEGNEIRKLEINENVSDKNVEQKTQEDELTQIKSKNADLNARLGKLKRVLSVMERLLKLQKGK